MIESIRLIPLTVPGDGGAPLIESLDRLAADLASALAVNCRVEPSEIDISATIDPTRQQAHSTLILRALRTAEADARHVRLGVAAADLYVPILTFVFGEAQINGPAAVVSLHRLRNEFYGLPADQRQAARRLLKEALHEIGHTQGLRHCDEHTCVMSSAHNVERVDLRSGRYCPKCSFTLIRPSQVAR